MEAFDQIILGENVHFCKFCHKCETQTQILTIYMYIYDRVSYSGPPEAINNILGEHNPRPPISCMKPCMIANLQIQIYTHVQFNYN